MILMLETLGKVRVMLKNTQAQTLVQSIPLPALEYGWAQKSSSHGGGATVSSVYKDPLGLISSPLPPSWSIDLPKDKGESQGG